MTPCKVPGCPALATHGEQCAAHVSTAVRVPFDKHPPRICARCGEEIRKGTWQRLEVIGYVHGGYLCAPREETHAH